MGKLKKSIYDRLTPQQQAEVTQSGIRVYDDSQAPIGGTLSFDSATRRPMSDTVTQARPVQMSPMAGVGVPASTNEYDDPETTRNIMRTAGAAGGAMIGAASAPASGPFAIPASLGLQGLGSAAGDYFAQLMFQTPQSPPSLKQAATTGLVDAGTGGLMHVIGYGLARGASIPKESIREAALRPKEILKPLGGEEFYDLTGNMASDLRNRSANVLTRGRRDLLEMMEAKSGEKMDPRVIARALEESQIGYARPEVKAVDAALGRHSGDLSERIDKIVPKDAGVVTEQVQMRILDESGTPFTTTVNRPVEIPRYEVSPKQYDTLVQQEMTAALKKYYEQHGGKLYIKALASARKKATDYLYDTLGEGARRAGQRANRELKVRERVQRLVSKTEAQTVTSAPQKLRAALDKSNVGTGVEVRKALENLDKQEGTQWLKTLEDLSMREHWSPLDQQAAAEITAFALYTGYRNRGFLERSAAYLGKKAIQAGVPAVKSRAAFGSIVSETGSRLISPRESSVSAFEQAMKGDRK